jgi:hypothetical protein
LVGVAERIQQIEVGEKHKVCGHLSGVVGQEPLSNQILLAFRPSHTTAAMGCVPVDLQQQRCRALGFKMMSSLATGDTDDDVVVSALLSEKEAVLYAPEAVDGPIGERHENRGGGFRHLGAHSFGCSLGGVERAQLVEAPLRDSICVCVEQGAHQSSLDIMVATRSL